MDRSATDAAQVTTVVVVDDERPIVDVVCDTLAEAGISAVGCTHAAEAFWCIGQYQPQLLILDVQMPGVNGIELLQQLRANPETAMLPVLFLTANSHLIRKQLPHYQALGATLLPKPFEIDHFLTLVTEVLSG
jgi:DNA-binding response OmpR family regulator